MVFTVDNSATGIFVVTTASVTITTASVVARVAVAVTLECSAPELRWQASSLSTSSVVVVLSGYFKESIGSPPAKIAFNFKLQQSNAKPHSACRPTSYGPITAITASLRASFTAPITVAVSLRLS
jgi:hypothetical protein